MIQIAHRGCSNLCKDNTKEAFSKAIEENFDMIELDIQLSKDEQIFIHHDIFIHSFLLQNLTLQEIKNIDPDILTLQEFFSMVDTTKIQIYLDIKGNNTKICSFLDQFLQDKNISNIFLASFNFNIIFTLSQINSNYQLGMITDNVIPISFLKQYIHLYQPVFFSFEWSILTKEIIDFLHEENILVYIYTCKNDYIFSFLKKLNVDGIVTNYKLKFE
jgi:glycerophosphoryl diester phosphodiesterase